MKAGLDGNRAFQPLQTLSIWRPDRPVFNLMIPYRLDTLQLTQEKEKKLSCLVFYWVIQK